MMKKTLLAIALTAISATAAQAASLENAKDSGTRVYKELAVVAPTELQAFIYGVTELPNNVAGNTGVWNVEVRNKGFTPVNANQWGVQIFGKYDEQSKTLTITRHNGDVGKQSDNLKLTYLLPSNYQYDSNDGNSVTFVGTTNINPEETIQRVDLITAGGSQIITPGVYTLSAIAKMSTQ